MRIESRVLPYIVLSKSSFMKVKCLVKPWRKIHNWPIKAIYASFTNQFHSNRTIKIMYLKNTNAWLLIYLTIYCVLCIFSNILIVLIYTRLHSYELYNKCENNKLATDCTVDLKSYYLTVILIDWIYRPKVEKIICNLSNCSILTLIFN